jgi:hypothetical protein
MPADGADLDGRLPGRSAAGRRLLSRRRGLSQPELRLSIVLSSEGWIAEHGVCGEDLLEGSVGFGAARLISGCAGVRMVAPKQDAVCVADVVWGCVPGEPQDGVKVAVGCLHDSFGAVAVVPAAVTAGTTLR